VICCGIGVLYLGELFGCFVYRGEGYVEFVCVGGG